MVHKKRILHITSSLKMGGAEQVLFQLLRSLHDDFEHTVIYFNEGPFVEKIKSLGISVYQVKGFFCRYDPLFWWRLYRLIKALNPDVIHTLLWVANFAGRLLGHLLKKPVVCAIHSPCNTNAGFSSQRLFLDRLTMKWASRVICVSKQIPLVPLAIQPAQVTYIENGVDSDWLYERSKKRIIQKASNHIIIGTVGRLVSIKNQEVLLYLIKELKPIYSNIQLMIIGDGPLRLSLLDKAQELHIADMVTIIADEATFYYPLFDLFILSSFAEGLSIALLEAMSFGIIPLVASSKKHDVIIHNSNGFLFNANNINELVQMVKNILNEEVDIENMKNRAVQTVRTRFSIFQMAQSYKHVYEELSNDY